MFKPKKMLLMAMIMFLMSSIVSAQKKETYSGKMVLPSDIVAIELRSSGDYEPGETQGTAKYEYYTDSEGKRIKNGKFEFSFNTYSGGIFHETITGEYLDNKKTGKWSFDATPSFRITTRLKKDCMPLRPSAMRKNG